MGARGAVKRVKYKIIGGSSRERYYILVVLMENENVIVHQQFVQLQIIYIIGTGLVRIVIYRAA